MQSEKWTVQEQVIADLPVFARPGLVLGKEVVVEGQTGVCYHRWLVGKLAAAILSNPAVDQFKGSPDGCAQIAAAAEAVAHAIIRRLARQEV